MRGRLLFIVTVLIEIGLAASLNVFSNLPPVTDWIVQHPTFSVALLLAHVFLALKLWESTPQPEPAPARGSVVVSQKESIIPWWIMVLLALLISPFDIIPDVLVGFGQVDDAGYVGGIIIALINRCRGR